MRKYTLAPFFWTQQQDEILVTNDAGRFLFMPQESFRSFVNGDLAADSQILHDLCNKGFVLLSPLQAYLDQWSMEVRRSKGCHFSATQLFILVLTSACNQRCVYCQASAGHENKYMSSDTAYKAIDLAFSSPANNITLEFQGGEPTLNVTVLRDAVLYAKELQATSGKNLSLTIVTNLTAADDELLGWLMDHDVGICSSLDGPEYIHNMNRPMGNSSNAYVSFYEGVRKYQDACSKREKIAVVQAIQTTTRISLNAGKQIVEEYRKLGCDAIYLRPLTPLGFAARSWEDIGYTPDEYLVYYRQVVNYLLSLERDGIQFKEITAGILLHRILFHEAVSHTEHRSPCGGAIGQMAIQYNGDVFTCDEARMLGATGDTAFKIGSVDDSYATLISSPVVHALCTASCIEGLPECCDCVYQPYCSTCPVVTYGLENDIFSHQFEAYHCKISKGIFDFLFSIIRKADSKDMEILERWAQ